MKGRPKTIRKITFMPAVSGFKPYGGVAEKQRKACVFLFYEEYEALRLSDYEKLSQCEAAVIMQVSRPTFTRIYGSAREKIAKAFVEGLRIVVEGGKVELDGDWYVCKKCKAVFSNEGGTEQVCALCGSEEIAPYQLSNTAEPILGSNENSSSAVAGWVPALGGRRGGCKRARCCQARPGTKKENE